MDDLKSIDENLYLVYHPFAMIWDNLMNQYEGELEDPRFCIHREHGEEVWGFVTTDGDGAPIPEGAWHVWRLWEPHGWTHVIRVDSKHDAYLKIVVERLHLQATVRDKDGDFAWNKHLQEEQSVEQLKQQAHADEAFGAMQEENSWLTKNAMDNFERGKTAPTNPTIEKVVSYAGQKNKTATSRPLEDKDVGLKGIDDL
jgi:hypothetical protein